MGPGECGCLPRVAVLTRLPGVGALTVLVISGEVEDVAWFTSARKPRPLDGTDTTVRGSSSCRAGLLLAAVDSVRGGADRETVPGVRRDLKSRSPADGARALPSPPPPRAGCSPVPGTSLVDIPAPGRWAGRHRSPVQADPRRGQGTEVGWAGPGRVRNRPWFVLDDTDRAARPGCTVMAPTLDTSAEWVYKGDGWARHVLRGSRCFLPGRATSSSSSCVHLPSFVGAQLVRPRPFAQLTGLRALQLDPRGDRDCGLRGGRRKGATRTR